MEFTHSEGLPGPLDNSVLWLQDRHISEKVWNNEDGSDTHLVLRAPWTRCKRLAAKLNNDPRVLTLLHRAGFYGVHRIGYRNTDHHLISALVERWRRETHTFFFNSGEATVTLEDIAVLLHLPIDGEPVTGEYKRHTIQHWSELTNEMLGFPIEQVDLRSHAHNQIKLTSLYNKTVELIDAHGIEHLDQHQVEQVTRAYMLLMIGFMYSTACGDSVDLSMLYLVSDLQSPSPRYSWGSALLAIMYRNLCSACMRENMGASMPTIAGPMMYLQVWAWCRLPFFSPTLTRPRGGYQLDKLELPDGVVLPAAPPAALWLNSGHGNQQIATHSLRVAREALDAQNLQNFKWQPYKEEDYEQLPETCPRNLFDYDGPMIYWHVVEHVRANRVLRQFGRLPSIPVVPPRIDDDLHGIDKIRCENYTQLHRIHLELWRVRAQHKREDLPTEVEVDDREYYAWYHRVSRRSITNPQLAQPRGHPTGLAAFSYAVGKQLEHYKQTQDITILDNVLDMTEHRQRGTLPPNAGLPRAPQQGRALRRRRTRGDATTPSESLPLPDEHDCGGGSSISHPELLCNEPPVTPDVESSRSSVDHPKAITPDVMGSDNVTNLSNNTAADVQIDIVNDVAEDIDMGINKGGNVDDTGVTEDGNKDGDEDGDKDKSESEAEDEHRDRRGCRKRIKEDVPKQGMDTINIEIAEKDHRGCRKAR